MQWFKRHPEFLRSESTALSNDSNYYEVHQHRDNLFLSHGNIIVRLDKVYKHPVLIVYTDATPYQLPLVYLLENEFSKNEVEYLASLSLGTLVNEIQTKVKFYYKLRHQNSSGSLCILEWDNLDDGCKFYGITTVIKRVRDWFAGLVTGVFPPDSQEVEYCAHFKNVDSENFFLYPEEFLRADLVQGSFYAVRINKAINKGGAIYLGCFIDGVTRSGLFTENTPYVCPIQIDERLKSSFDFQKEEILVDSYVASGELLPGIWLTIKDTLPPFRSLNDLITVIGEDNFNDGLKKFESASHHYFRKTAADEFVVGIRYPNKRALFEFQTFKVLLKKTPPPMAISHDPIERIQGILNRYDLVKAIPGEKFSAERFHLRNSSRADYEKLKGKAINMFGVGSLGSEIADGLAKAGFGDIALFDNQVVMPGNPVRHTAGINYIGVSKVNAVKHLLSAHNPFISAYATSCDLYSNGLLFILDKHSWTISSLADDNLEGFLNEQAIIANKTMFYVRALRGGKVGRIFRVVPGRDACFQCLNLYRREDSQFIKILPDESLPTLFNECNNPVRPGSAVDLKMIASIAGRIIIDQAQSGMTKENHWIWSSEVISGSIINEAFKLHSHHIPPHPKCLYCNHDRELNVSVSRESLQRMMDLVKEKSGIETGGVLAGMSDKEGNIIITHASGPGPKALHTKMTFEKDIEFCQNFLDNLFESSGGTALYVGEWHSHPEDDNMPSGIDIKSLSEIALQKEYLTVNPAMIIFSTEGTPSCSIHPAGKLHYFTELNIV